MRRRDFVKPMMTMPLLASASAANARASASGSLIDVGSDRQLFVDDHLIARLTGVQLKLHSPRPRETVLQMDQPWEGTTSSGVEVIQDGDRYRMWYRAREDEAGKGKLWEHAAYAESHDGVHWERPNLGLFEFRGSKKNNLVWQGPGGNICVFKNEKPGVPDSERYKAITRARGAYGLISPDGVRWRLVQDEYILTGGLFDSHNVVFLDPWTHEYVYYGRGWVKPPPGVTSPSRHGLRRIRRATSRDFRRWSPLKFIDMGIEPMDHLYTNAARPYWRSRRLYLMFPRRFVPERKFHHDATSEGASDSVFASSRDGIHWDRTFLEAFLRAGLDPNNWYDRAFTIGPSLVETGPQELSLYYIENYRTKNCHVRRGTIRPDGFVSINASYRGGEMVTKPLLFRGRNLWINYSTSAVGFVKAEIQEVNGKPIPGFTLTDSSEVFGDELERAITWASNSDVAKLEGQPIRLKFAMKDADLYSFRFGNV